jgi:hypothetical protein
MWAAVIPSRIVTEPTESECTTPLIASEIAGRTVDCQRVMNEDITRSATREGSPRMRSEQESSREKLKTAATVSSARAKLDPSVLLLHPRNP